MSDVFSTILRIGSRTTRIQEIEVVQYVGVKDANQSNFVFLFPFEFNCYLKFVISEILKLPRP